MRYLSEAGDTPVTEFNLRHEEYGGVGRGAHRRLRTPVLPVGEAQKLA